MFRAINSYSSGRGRPQTCQHRNRPQYVQQYIAERSGLGVVWERNIKFQVNLANGERVNAPTFFAAPNRLIELTGSLLLPPRTAS